MKDTELRKRRDADLYREYVKGLETGCFANMSEAAEYVIRQPAPQFYISSREVNLYIGRIQAGISLITLNSTSRRRVWQLYDNYLLYLQQHPDCNLSRERVLELLVEEPAPEYYVTWRSAREILRKEVNKRRQRWARH